MVRVWDPFVRVFHWSLVGIFLANRFFNESGELWHERLGYAACALIGLRVLWGFWGTTYARFAEMARCWPLRCELRSYLWSYLLGKAPRTLGHSPPAQVGTAIMLFCFLGLGLTGWMMGLDRFFGEELLEELHELLGNALLLLAIGHVLAVLRMSFVHRENLAGSMIHGKKRPD